MLKCWKSLVQACWRFMAGRESRKGEWRWLSYRKILKWCICKNWYIYISKITQVNFVSQICDLQATYWPCQLGTYQSCQRLCPGTPLLNFWSRSSLSISISIYLCNIVFTRICHIFCAGSCHSKWQYPKPAGCERLHASVWSWGGELKRNNGCGPHLLHP